jgi:hypothetical protein
MLKSPSGPQQSLGFSFISISEFTGNFRASAVVVPIDLIDELADQRVLGQSPVFSVLVRFVVRLQQFAGQRCDARRHLIEMPAMHARVEEQLARPFGSGLVAHR